MTNPDAPTPEVASSDELIEVASDIRKLIESAPPHIWLNLGENLEALTAKGTFRDLKEVTWSEDNATGTGIKYVRAPQAGLGVPGQRVASDVTADRELLELAAKAAGVEGHFCAKKELDTERWGIVTFLGYGQAAFWNPLTDDGDALRLAVKLELFDLDVLLVDLDCNDRAASHHLDPLAATRRAITRAAAYIARATKEQP